MFYDMFNISVLVLRFTKCTQFE